MMIFVMLGPCFPGMQQLILAKCINGVRFDSKDYGDGYGQAATDSYNSKRNRPRKNCMRPRFKG
ncbi:MAG TPA: hypothetical protein VEL11_18745 [Candidatus Bathyarchaeia archaeon]|nr:hypothetical protein [Candidatus Bathyarchaeia archaeon]